MGIGDNKVHQVMVQKNSGYNLLPRQEFLSLPLLERTNLMMGGKVKFLDAEGNIIPLVEGARDIHKAKNECKK